MVREAEKVLESDPEIPLRQTYIEKLDAELQTLGWLARFPEKVDSPYINRQLLDKYGIEPGIPREEQSRQAEKAFRELDARLGPQHIRPVGRLRPYEPRAGDRQLHQAGRRSRQERLHHAAKLSGNRKDL